MEGKVRTVFDIEEGDIDFPTLLGYIIVEFK